MKFLVVKWGQGPVGAGNSGAREQWGQGAVGAGNSGGREQWEQGTVGAGKSGDSEAAVLILFTHTVTAPASSAALLTPLCSLPACNAVPRRESSLKVCGGRCIGSNRRRRKALPLLALGFLAGLRPHFQPCCLLHKPALIMHRATYSALAELR